MYSTLVILTAVGVMEENKINKHPLVLAQANVFTSRPQWPQMFVSNTIMLFPVYEV